MSATARLGTATACPPLYASPAAHLMRPGSFYPNLGSWAHRQTHILRAATMLVDTNCRAAWQDGTR